MICGSERSKSRLAKAAGAEPCGQMRDESYKVARRRGVKHISKSKCTKHTNIGPLLEVGSCDLEKVHAVVAFKMCFAPQRRALFQHLNFQKCSEFASF